MCNIYSTSMIDVFTIVSPFHITYRNIASHLLALSSSKRLQGFWASRFSHSQLAQAAKCLASCSSSPEKLAVKAKLQTSSCHFLSIYNIHPILAILAILVYTCNMLLWCIDLYDSCRCMSHHHFDVSSFCFVNLVLQIIPSNPLQARNIGCCQYQ